MQLRKSSFAWMIILLLVGGCCPSNDEITTFILVRHAEKGNDGTGDPDLTDEGYFLARESSVVSREM